MGWLFLFAVLFLLVFLVLNSNRTRLVALGVLVFMAAVVSVYLLLLDEAEHREVPPAADDRLKDTRELAKRTALVREAIKPQDIAFNHQKFGPGVQEQRGSDGKLVERPDLYSWKFSGVLKNLNERYAVRDAVFRVRLFSCPDFVTGDIDLAAMEVRCITIGDRRLALYDLGIEPAGSVPFAEDVTFDNQPKPGNWRYWVETISVTAKID